VATVEDVRRLVEWHLGQGAGFVKLMASGGGLTPGTVPHEADLPLELMRAAAELAHAHGVQITAHCHATESITRALDAGLDMIEHVSFTEPPGRYRYDEDITRRIRDRGVVVSPTVYCALRTARHFRESGVVHNANDLAAVERLEGRLTNTAHFHRLGLKIIGGTDCGATDTPFDSLVDELVTYTQAGLSNAEALRTVTSDSAAYMNLPRLGEVKVGHQADLVLTAANPLEDLNALRQPLMVFKSGRLVHESQGEVVTQG
jgi:imidazolonepropionase-like amidohydrolase